MLSLGILQVFCSSAASSVDSATSSRLEAFDRLRLGTSVGTTGNRLILLASSWRLEATDVLRVGEHAAIGGVHSVDINAVSDTMDSEQAGTRRMFACLVYRSFRSGLQ